MRRFLSTLLLGLVLALPLRADNPVVLQQIAFSSVTTGTSILVRSTGASEWRIRWVAVSTPATCTVKLEQSEDNSSWSDLIAGQTCTSSGISVFTTGHPLYVRLNVTVLTGGTVNATLLGYIAEVPVTASALDIRPLTNSDVVTAEQATHDNLNANANLQVGDTDVSTSNLVPVGGAAAGGDTAAGNPVLVGGLANDGDVESLAITQGGLIATMSGAVSSDGLSNSVTGRFQAVDSARLPTIAPLNFNGTSWDRQRNNEEVTLLASAARTAQTDSTDQVNYNAKGIMIILDITVDAASVGLTPSILMKDPVSGKDVTIWTAAAAATLVGTDIYLIYPGALAADFNGTEAVSIALPRTWVLRIAVADADEATYSVGASYIQ